MVIITTAFISSVDCHGVTIASCAELCLCVFYVRVCLSCACLSNSAFGCHIPINLYLCIGAYAIAYTLLYCCII